MTGAVDKRVVAIVPVVMDELNTAKVLILLTCVFTVYNLQNLHHHYRAYGGWTWAFHDYYELNFTEHLDDPCAHTLLDFIDPLGIYVDHVIP